MAFERRIGVGSLHSEKNGKSANRSKGGGSSRAHGAVDDTMDCSDSDMADVQLDAGVNRGRGVNRVGCGDVCAG